jgi:hypothetical protein
MPLAPISFHPRLNKQALKLMREKMKNIILILAICLPALSKAQDFNHEIQYLKQYINTSQCLFNRNSDIHTAPEALKHIEKKYQYFKDDITSAERFIDTSASKSTLSGKAYTVTCPAEHKQQGHGIQTLSSQVWLLRALIDYRSSNK